MTTTRALRGPFDYRLPEPMVEAGVGVGSLLMVPFGGRADARRRRRRRRRERPAAGAARRADRGDRGRRDAGARPARALGRRALLLDAVPGPGAGPAAGLGDRPQAAADAGRGPSAGRRSPTDGPRRSTRRARARGSAPRQRAALERLEPTAASCPGRGSASSPGPTRSSSRGSPSAGLIERRTREVRRAPRIDTVGAVAAAPRLSAAAGAPARRRSSPRSTATARASACFTASPARARPRSTSRPSRRRSSAAAARSCSFPRSA